MRLTLPRSGMARQALLFLAAYLVYGASRWVLTGDESTALDHTRWIVDLEEGLGVDVEASVQSALEGTAVLWLLNHAYIAAQLIVVPGVLIWLYRRNRQVYLRLRDTVLATWLLALRLRTRGLRRARRSAPRPLVPPPRSRLGADDLPRRRRHRQPLRVRHRGRHRHHRPRLPRRGAHQPAVAHSRAGAGGTISSAP